VTCTWTEGREGGGQEGRKEGTEGRDRGKETGREEGRNTNFISRGLRYIMHSINKPAVLIKITNSIYFN